MSQCTNTGSSTTGGALYGASRVPSVVTQQSFQAPFVGALTVSINVDNDVQVWLDGANVTRLGQAPPGFGHLDAGSPVTADDDWWSRDRCAIVAAPTFTLPNVASGSHVVAIYVDGRIGTSVLNAKGTLIP